MIDQATQIMALSAMVATTTGPVVVRIDDLDAVVLQPVSEAEIEVWIAGAVRSCPADLPAGLVTNPAQRELVLRAATASLDQLRRVGLANAASLRQEYTAQLAAIRVYAIEAHQEGDICRQGLDEFLSSFGLPDYNPHVRVRYELSGNFTAAGADEATVRAATIDTVGPNFAGINQADQSSSEHQVVISDLRPIALDDGRRAIAVTFVLSGVYDDSRDDVDEAISDCRWHLGAVIKDVGDIVVGSVMFEVTDVETDLVF